MPQLLFKALTTGQNLKPSVPNRKIRILAGRITHVTGTDSLVVMRPTVEGAVGTIYANIVRVDAAVPTMQVPFFNQLDEYTMVAGTVGIVVTQLTNVEVPYGCEIYTYNTCSILYEEVLA